MISIKRATLLGFFLIIWSSMLFAEQLEFARSGSELDGTAIDLLVGTPSGVKEPLDARRTKPEPNIDNDLSEFLNYDPTFEENTEADLSWQDAEETNREIDDEAGSIKDLIDEIEDFEAQTDNDSQVEFNDNISDYVETELKL